MEFIKSHKFTFVAIAVFLVLVILLVQVKNIFFPNEKKAAYGDRLDGIEEVEVTKSKLDKIDSTLKSDDKVKKSSTSTQGKIIEVIITVNDDVAVGDAKTLADKAFEVLSKNQKKYYDMQVFIKKDTDAKDFPIIGYHHHTKTAFSWTKDRTE